MTRDLCRIDTHPPAAEFVYRLLSLSLAPLIIKPILELLINNLATLTDNTIAAKSLNYGEGIFSSDISHLSIFFIKNFTFAYLIVVIEFKFSIK